MPTSSQWLAFLVASILFIQVPGPSLLFTIGRALSVGRREALLSVCGNALGIACQTVFVALGLGAIVAASATAYSALKLCGAAYVVYLGIQAIRHRSDARLILEGMRPSATRQSRPVRMGFVVGVTNPKTLVYFAAFLPQFVNEGAGSTGPQIALLGAVFALMAVMSDSVWALAASRARDWFARRPSRLDSLGLVGGLSMVGLGATMAATD
ncbi:LysE family translocator [Nocardioides sp. InS609-2]|uniref:LysE family translocator n=1 Tax=Nocardioides sp. InS609-2 TaxID=2760705 RepID=UPI0020C14C05|nr:LysE family translocator [Nocardioides sp. InS609-2]